MAIDDPQGPVLLCFDGSEGARRAIRHAGRLLGDGRPGAVVFVFQPPEQSWGGLSWLTGQGIDAPVVSRPDAEDLLKEAVALAQAAGFAAQPLLVQAEHPTAATLVDVAEDRDVPVIVMGQRGLSGLKSTVLGSVSRDVANAFHRPVLLV